MSIEIVVRRSIVAPPASVFELALDPQRFPRMFTGCGPIPALRRVTPQAPPAVGSTRDIESADGSVLHERITAFEPPRRHAYTLTGVRPPLAWLVRQGDADWTFDVAGNATDVTWRYAFAPTNALARPLASLLLTLFMRRAMQRCLDAMAQTLETGNAA